MDDWHLCRYAIAAVQVQELRKRAAQLPDDYLVVFAGERRVEVGWRSAGLEEGEASTCLEWGASITATYPVQKQLNHDLVLLSLRTHIHSSTHSTPPSDTRTRQVT